MKIHRELSLFIMTSAFALLLAKAFSMALNLSGASALIASHVVLGSVAFLVGGISLITKKGSAKHKSSGQLFYLSMSVSVFLSLLVSVMPNHFSLSLFQIGILSLYFLVGGKRSIYFKQPNLNLTVDKWSAYSVILVSLAIFCYTLLIKGYLHPLITVFGVIGITFGLIDLVLFRQLKTIKRYWLALHLSKMLAGYTAAVTAFFVAQNFFTGYFNWFLPPAVGLLTILYWLVKLRVIKFDNVFERRSLSN